MRCSRWGNYCPRATLIGRLLKWLSGFDFVTRLFPVAFVLAFRAPLALPDGIGSLTDALVFFVLVLHGVVSSR